MLLAISPLLLGLLACSGMMHSLRATRQNNVTSSNDGNWAWEWWYKFQVTDNISVTPGFFYLSRPMGANTPVNNAAGTANGFFNSFGYLVKTTFKF